MQSKKGSQMADLQVARDQPPAARMLALAAM